MSTSVLASLGAGIITLDAKSALAAIAITSAVVREYPVHARNVSGADSASLQYFVSTCFYNLFLSPLRKYPGPWFAAACPIPFVWAMCTGRWSIWLIELHEKYGGVVRFGPDHLSYADSRSQKDIHAPVGLRHAYDKHPTLYQAVTSNEQSIFTSNGATHERHRRILLRAFTDGAIVRLGKTIKTYITQLMDRLDEHSAASTPANMQDLLLFVTVDTAADLLFGEPFNMTRDGKYNGFVAGVLNLTHIGQVVAGLQQLRWFRFIWNHAIQYAVQPVLQKHQQATDVRVQRRLDGGAVDAREDIIKYALSGKEKLNTPELFLNASHLWLAASETSTTSLAAMTFFLLQHPEAYRRLVEEVRTTFETEEDLADTARLPTLKWVDACIKEAQRLHSPLPTPLPRYIPAGGADICGQFVPEGSCVVVTTDAAYRSKDNFHDPLSFRPERWLDERDPVFENDKREVFQPFLLGPKSCIGKP